MDVVDVALRVAEALERCGVAYFLGGSLASSVHGEPRAANDVDLVVDLSEADVAPFVAALGPDFDVDEVALRRAARERASWSLVHVPSVTRIDLFMRRPGAFDDREFARSAPLEVRAGRSLVVKSAEDTVLRKLLWYRGGARHSERHWLDVVEVLRISAEVLDGAYLDLWAACLDVADLLARARGEAGNGHGGSMTMNLRDPAALLDHPRIGWSYFFPRPTPVPSPFWIDAGDARLACSLHRAEDPAALTIVHFHGNGEVVADWMEGFPERVTSSIGCNLLLAEYRGYGMSTGAPLLGKMLDDVEAVVRGAGAPPEKIILFGRSVGSLFALEGAWRFPNVAGLVLESGIADVLERLLLRVDPEDLGVPPEALAAAVAARLDHRKKLGAYEGPVLVMHARFDELVPVTHGERLARWAAGPVILKLMDRGGHNTILAENEDPYFGALGELVALAGGSPRGDA